MKKKKGVEIKINLSNKAIYTFIVLGILIIVGVGVYALGSVPNPGHAISGLQTCEEGETLQIVGGEWSCVDMSSDADTRCDISGTCSQICIGSDCTNNLHVSGGLYGFGVDTGNVCQYTKSPLFSKFVPPYSSECSCPTGYTLLQITERSDGEVYMCYKD